MKNLSRAIMLTIAALVWCAGHEALASNAPGSASGNVSVLTSSSVLMEESGTNTTALVAPGPGELFVTVTDLQFPTSFASLQYGITDASGTILPLTAGNTTTTINLTAPDTLYANVFATVGSGGAGLFNLTATFVSAVPLPASLGLFAGGGLLLALGGRRRNPLRRAMGVSAARAA